jgi:hypothetical protein
MNLFFWLLLNLGVPIAGPIFMLTLFSVTHGKALARRLIVESVAKGQLLWSAIALSAAAIYELATALENQRGLTSFLELAIAAFTLIAFTCSILVTLATLKDYSERLARDEAEPPAGIPRIAMNSIHSSPAATLKVSIWLTATAAFLFAALHTYVC